MLGLVAYNCVVFVGAKIFYVTVNRLVSSGLRKCVRYDPENMLMLRRRRREKRWSSMSKEEKETYLATTTDKGNKRLDFRFAH